MTENIEIFTAPRLTLHKPTQNVDPVLQWIVDTGKLEAKPETRAIEPRYRLPGQRGILRGGLRRGGR
jgi:hypothetical protein